MTETPVPFLSDLWCQMAAESARDSPVPTPPVCASRVCHVVNGGPNGEVRYLVTLKEGRVLAVDLLQDKSCKDADVVLTAQFDDAVGVAKGEENPAVLFMQGRLKTAGDPGLALDYLRLVSFPPALEWRRQLAARTDFAAG